MANGYTTRNIVAKALGLNDSWGHKESPIRYCGIPVSIEVDAERANATLNFQLKFGVRTEKYKASHKIHHGFSVVEMKRLAGLSIMEFFAHLNAMNVQDTILRDQKVVRERIAIWEAFKKEAHSLIQGVKELSLDILYPEVDPNNKSVRTQALKFQANSRKQHMDFGAASVDYTAQDDDLLKESMEVQFSIYSRTRQSNFNTRMIYQTTKEFQERAIQDFKAFLALYIPYVALEKHHFDT